MTKPDRTDRYKGYDVMLPQGARSRFTKMMHALEEADELLPADALDGTAHDLRQALNHLQTAQTNLCELIAYRKMAGVD